MVVGTLEGAPVKWIVTGAAGMLGRDVVDYCERQSHDVVSLTRADLDLTDASSVDECVSALRPNVIVNCAGFTAVDACETDHDKAFAGNATVPRNLAAACDRVDARLIHISTDYVFDGTKSAPYHELDPTNPLSVYGASKLAGELAVQEILGDDSTILRTSWVCGEHGPNMVKTVLHLASGEGPLRFVNDQRGCPTFTADLAIAIDRFATSSTGGLFHVTNQGAVSWYEFVLEIVRELGADTARVEPIASKDLQPPRPAPRPANSVLENRAMTAAAMPLLDDFRVPLRQLVATLVAPSP